MSDKLLNSWQFWIDRGGTFTDIVAHNSQGKFIVHKLLSKNPRYYKDAAGHGIRHILNIEDDGAQISEIKMGTTIATNALLERKGEKTALVVNEGFSDILRIGYQARPDIFKRHIVIPENLYSMVLEVPGRLNADGAEIEKFNSEAAKQELIKAKENGIKSIAIAFMHSYLNDTHEVICGEIAKQLGFETIAISSKTSPLIKLVFRGDTTVVDAYLSPVLNNYIEEFESHISSTKTYFMQSNGGLVDRAHFSGKDSLLSGPAGGVVGAVKTCLNTGFKKVIGFDMGGTSTDVSHYEKEFSIKDENVIAGVRVRTPVIDIHTIAAGGGSIIYFDGQRFRVGPQSAGAYPGPSCYRNGGPLTITDCNLVLSRIQESFFPKVFGPDGCQPLDPEIVRKDFELLQKEIENKSELKNVEEIAWGFLEIAIEKMAQAIKKITIERGIDIKDHVLASFGGAGGQHACLIAEKLDLTTVVIHPLAGVLSALGIGLADVKVVENKSIQTKLTSALVKELETTFDTLKKVALKKIKEQTDLIENTRVSNQILIRYQGSDTCLSVKFAELEKMRTAFYEKHQSRFGFNNPEKALIVDSVRLEATQPTNKTEHNFLNTPQELNELKENDSETTMFSKGSWHKTKILSRSNLSKENKIQGPAIIMDSTSTNIIEPGWSAHLGLDLSLIIEREEVKEKTPETQNESRTNLKKVNPIMLELFNSKFMAIAEEMGVTLRNTSHSVNIKERLDFSCAVFDSQGRLIANAPHMPVHLGSMGASVQSVIDKFGDSLRDGNCYILNNPYNGGTHLPDITVVTPVFLDQNKPLFYTASRGHHADIGGITPGSMPPQSKNIDEEGALIDPTPLVENGKFLEEKITAIFKNTKYPARNIAQNIADLKAQVAANKCGVSALAKLIKHFGLETVAAYMKFIRENASFCVRREIDKLKDGSFELKMDNQATIVVSIKVDKKTSRARVDFTGTSRQLPDSNFNAPSSITRAAVLYVFRTLVDDQIPLNEGCLEPIEIIIPEGTILNPTHPHAVVAGNVETSQAVVDALYGALGIQAASQGTMNNFTFGDDTYQYYETVCGGSGAGYDHPGTDAVQTHMTNSRLTDPEVLEWRYPVLIKKFKIRKNSGGDGKHRGGDGVIREIQFLKPMKASILSQRRNVQPFGLMGGKPAKAGKNYVIRHSGKIINLKGTDSIEMIEGDKFVIETPGGGGFGESE